MIETADFRRSAARSAGRSTPPPGDYIGQYLEVRADSALVKLFHRGQLVKIHPRQAAAGRFTDPDDLPAAKVGYAMRDLDRLIAAAVATVAMWASTPSGCWTTRCRGPECGRSTGCSCWSP